MAPDPRESALSIPKTHKVAIFTQKGGPVAVKEVPVPQQSDLKPGEALVRVIYSGVCHTGTYITHRSLAAFKKRCWRKSVILNPAPLQKKPLSSFAFSIFHSTYSLRSPCYAWVGVFTRRIEVASHDLRPSLLSPKILIDLLSFNASFSI